MAACREQLPFMFLTRGQYPDFRTLSDFRKDNLEFLADAFAQVVADSQTDGARQAGRGGHRQHEDSRQRRLAQDERQGAAA